LPTPGGPSSRTFLLARQEGQRGEIEDLGAVERGLEGEVEGIQGAHEREPRQAQGTFDAALLADGDLLLQQAIEHRGVAIGPLLGGLEHLGQDVLGAPQAEPLEVGHQAVVGGLAHRAPPMAWA
jgi:hypothetical protein